MTIRRPLAAAAAAALAIVTLSGCSVIDTIFEDGPPKDPMERHFDSFADAPTKGDLTFGLPSLVPKDAVDLDVRLMAGAAPGYLLRYTSSTGFKDARCEAVESAPPPAMDAEWWPDSLEGAAWECAEKRWTRPVYALADGDTVYAWTADDEPATGTTPDDVTPETAEDPAE